MDAQRKSAYRAVIYTFFLDIRTVPLPLTDDELASKIGQYAGPVAYQLHNLALASVQDFVGFDEMGFWASLEGFDKLNPDNIIAAHYRIVFEQALTGK